MLLRKINIFAFGLGVALAGAIYSPAVEASNLDTYKKLLVNHTYTIKYQDITPAPRVTNRNAIKIYGKNDMDNSKSAFMLYKQTEGVIVANGENRYEEVKAGEISQCRLQKGESTYVFVKQAKSAQNNLPPILNIFGSGGKNKVVPVETNYTAQIMLGESFGGDALTRYLNALLPDQYRSKDMPSFYYVDEGWLDNGLNYVDLKAKQGIVNEAVRYYFNGYNMVKIAAIRYWRNNNGVFESEKTIIRINEFSPKPQEEYLQLPPGVKESKPKKK